MTAKGHVVLAVTPLSAMYGLEIFQHPVILSLVAIGSLLPDVDEKGSYIGRKLFFISGMFRDLGIQHRGFTHFLVIPLTLMLVSYLVMDGGWLFWLSFGILMHDVGDLLTKSGIHNFFFPLMDGYTAALLPKRFRFKTFSSAEKILIFILIALNILVCLWSVLR